MALPYGNRGVDRVQVFFTVQSNYFCVCFDFALIFMYFQTLAFITLIDFLLPLIYLPIIRGLSLQEMLDYIQELDETDQNEENDHPTTIYIEPPIDGNISGEDDADNEYEGIPDNVCPAQLKSGCEVVMASGQHFQKFINEEDDIGGKLDEDYPFCIE